MFFLKKYFFVLFKYHIYFLLEYNLDYNIYYILFIIRKFHNWYVKRI